MDRQRWPCTRGENKNGFRVNGSRGASQTLIDSRLKTSAAPFPRLLLLPHDLAHDRVETLALFHLVRNLLEEVIRASSGRDFVPVSER